MPLRFVIVAGPPSSGKTSVMLQVIRYLQQDSLKVCACKIDCLETADDRRYRSLGIPVCVGLSDYLCPDHFYVANLEEVWNWAESQKTDVLIIETAGLCHRCAPAVQGCLTVCVVDNLVGLDTPKKIGPMLGTADIIVITKGDVVSQAEREVFSHQVECVNGQAGIIHINGLNGQGALRLKKEILKMIPLQSITGGQLRYPMPAAICSYCAGETIVGSAYQMGNVKKIDFGENT
ncbi:GTP-binding protein [uncultured Desulfobacter sp.]|uniref:GTP-binding protein n=1 Tax=uncultured Desulfobacter sp. TaxID=240139 RepID=UPI002AABFF72|nr:GTP-binding protein [uncultured Desulfobacter sp.]